MALHNVFVQVDFLDAAERTATREYMLRQQWDDGSPGSWDTVIAEAGGLAAALEVLSWAEVTQYRAYVVIDNVDTPANVGANNQVVAFTRVKTAAGDKAYFEVPAWDDFTFDQNSANLLSAAYNTAAEDVAAFIKDPETGSNMSGGVEYSQSRTRKSRNVIKD